MAGWSDCLKPARVSEDTVSQERKLYTLTVLGKKD